ncbi:Kiwa anti-phage protein KwaB-like domain-containing protein [Colibacter massiliensis]|uniref:Kiwa anti-phage protein KwaB-like domain-containing protein n=1 Tax=Colibacter massiliensis TaxID=1852379 RepID=UPI003F90B077
MSIFEEIVNDLNSLDSNAEIRLYFTQKNKLGYTTYMPNVKNSLTSDLVELIKENIEKYASGEIVKFNPTSYRDGVIERCSTDYVGNFQEVLESFSAPDYVDTGLNANDLTFYCIEIKDNNDKFNYKFFRRVTKFKRLSSNGILAWFSGNTLNKMEQQMLGLDGYIDLVCVGTDIYIFNHISLERIFRLVEKYSDKAKEALQKLKDADGISNFDQFEEDCLSDQRYHKTLSKMLENNDNFGDVFNDFSSIRQVIDMFDLDIEIEECSDKPRLRYEDKHQKMDILRIINDAYYRSIIGKRKGINDN